MAHKQESVRTIIRTEEAPMSSAPLNQAIVVNNLVFCSGCLGIDKNTGKLVSGGIRAETEQTLKNLGAVLKASNSSFDRIVKATILLGDIADWPTVNDIYKTYFPDPAKYPARTAYQVGKLPAGAAIEIEVVAISGEVRDNQATSLL